MTKPKTQTPKKSRKGEYHDPRPGTTESVMAQRILSAWNRGDRSFDEVVAITGYTRDQVGFYLPYGIGRIR